MTMVLEKNQMEQKGGTIMRQFIIGFLMFGLIFGTAAFAKAGDVDIHVGKGKSSYNDNFSSWDASQRDRISDAYRDRSINRSEFDRLNKELSDVEAYHTQVSSKGRISRSDQERLEGMENRLSDDISRER